MALKVQDYLESLGVDIVLEKALNEIIGLVQAEEVIVGEEHIDADSCNFIHRHKTLY